MNFYMFYIGGNAGKSNIEVHDVQFAAVEKPEDAYPLLRETWFGDKKKIHLDGYTQLTWADGYDIRLSTEPYPGSQKLYFVNVGGYSPDTLAELHEFDLFVAETPTAAKQKALAALLTGAAHQHKDNLKDVDDCLLLEKVGEFYLHLVENPNGQPAKPHWQGYLPIGE